MSRRFDLALVTLIGLTVASLATAPAVAHDHGPWIGSHWHPWQGQHWQPYWRPYVYSTPYTYGYTYVDPPADCHWVHRRVRWEDARGHRHEGWRDVEICE